MKTIKNIKYLLLTLFFALIILLSTLFIPKIAKADTITDYSTFTSSNLFIPIKSFNANRNDNLTSSGVFNYGLTIDYDSSTSQYYLDFTNSSVSWIEYMQSQNRTIFYNYDRLSFYNLNNDFVDYSKIYINDLDYTFDISTYDNELRNNGYGATFNVVCNNLTEDNSTISTINIFVNSGTMNTLPTFQPNLVKVEFGNYLSSYGSLYGQRYWNYIKYTNYSGVSLTLSWYVGNSWCITTNDYSYAPMESLLNYRQYYFDTEFTQDVYFNNGYNKGYTDGSQDGFNQGYTDGSQDGYNQGYSKGKTDGIASANDYTFFGLLTALIDAPIQALFGNGEANSGLFNFEFLGVNLAGFYLSIFTIMIVLMIVRVVMKGG